MRTSESAELQINEKRYQRSIEFISKAETLKERILASIRTKDSVNVENLLNEARENFLLAIDQLTRISIKNDDYYRVKARYHFSHAQLYLLLNPRYALINDECYLAEVGAELSQASDDLESVIDKKMDDYRNLVIYFLGRCSNVLSSSTPTIVTQKKLQAIDQLLAKANYYFDMIVVKSKADYVLFINSLPELSAFYESYSEVRESLSAPQRNEKLIRVLLYNMQAVEKILEHNKFAGNNYDPSACYELVTTVAGRLMVANTNNAEKWMFFQLLKFCFSCEDIDITVTESHHQLEAIKMLAGLSFTAKMGPDNDFNVLCRLFFKLLLADRSVEELLYNPLVENPLVVPYIESLVSDCGKLMKSVDDVIAALEKFIQPQNSVALQLPLSTHTTPSQNAVTIDSTASTSEQTSDIEVQVIDESHNKKQYAISSQRNTHLSGKRKFADAVVPVAAEFVRPPSEMDPPNSKNKRMLPRRHSSANARALNKFGINANVGQSKRVKKTTTTKEDELTVTAQTAPTFKNSSPG